MKKLIILTIVMMFMIIPSVVKAAGSAQTMAGWLGSVSSNAADIANDKDDANANDRDDGNVNDHDDGNANDHDSGNSGDHDGGNDSGGDGGHGDGGHGNN
jgi:Ni/Co efflux regulator RcnB